MVCFPNCKINLGLNIVRKREDGYHDIETVFYPLALKEALEAVRTTGDEPVFTTSGLPIAGNETGNLCIKAWHLLKKDFPSLPAFQIHLHKAIPMGAGLGGGSSDGAFALQLFNQLGDLGLGNEQLQYYALQLGSDCPFFLYNRPCFASGRGELIEPLDLGLSGYHFLLVNPRIHISTASAFAGIRPAKPINGLRQLLSQPVENWKDHIMNDFEATVFPANPAIASIKQQLYEMGAVYASMSGTGSTVYGIFPKHQPLKHHFPLDWFIAISD